MKSTTDNLLTEHLLATLLSEAIRSGEAEVHSITWSYRTRGGTVMFRVGEAEFSMTTSNRDTILAFEKAKQDRDLEDQEAFDGPVALAGESEENTEARRRLHALGKGGE